MNEDDDITPEEAAEAEALARALADGQARPELPADAWQAAMLLRAKDDAPPPMPVALAQQVKAKKPKKRWLAWAGSGLALAATLTIAAISVKGGRREAPAPAMSEAAPAKEATKPPPEPTPIERLERVALDLARAPNVSAERCAEVCTDWRRLCVPANERCKDFEKPILDKCACKPDAK